MGKLKTWIVIVVALAFISTVTIFDPAYISDAFLNRLIPQRGGAQEEDVTVRVTFPRPVTTAAASVVVSGVADQAGNELAAASEQVVEAIEEEPARVTGHLAGFSDEGLVVCIGFDKRVLEKDATDPANFSLFVGDGPRSDLPAANLTYDDEGYIVTIRLKAPGSARMDDAYRLEVRGIPDVNGNVLEETSLTGRLRRTGTPLRAIEAFLNTTVSELGNLVDIRFSGILEQRAAESVLAYRLSSGELPRQVEVLPGGKSVRLRLRDSVLPGEMSLEVKGLLDAGGGPVPRVSALGINAMEVDPPRALAASAEVVEGFANDKVEIEFSEPLTRRDATELSHYSLQSPVGEEVPLAGGSVSYDDAARRTRLTLGNNVNLRPGDSFRVVLAGVRDLSGNPLTEQVLEGTVGGDRTPPRIERAVQNLYADETGATIDVVFTEPVEPKFLSDAGNFAIGGTQSPIGLWPAKDLRSVRIAYDRPLIPGEVRVTVREAADPAGNRGENLVAQLVPYEVKAPAVLGSIAEAVTGLNNDRVVVTFGEALVGGDAENPSNYRLFSPMGEERSLSDAKFTYISALHQVEITLGKTNLEEGETYALGISGVRDIGGNMIGADATTSGSVTGDNEPPRVAWAKAIGGGDAKGRGVAVGFSEVVEAESAERAVFTSKIGPAGSARLSEDGITLTVQFPPFLALGGWARGWVFLLGFLALGLGFWLVIAREKAFKKAGVMIAVAAAALLVFSTMARYASTVLISEIADPAGNVAYGLKGRVIGSHSGAVDAKVVASEGDLAAAGRRPNLVCAKHKRKVSQKEINKALSARKLHMRVSAVAGGGVHLEFDTALDQNTTEDINNYYLNDQIDPQSRPRLAVLSADEKSVRLFFSKAVLPGREALLVRNLRAKGGERMETKVGVEIEPEETTPPRVVGARATATTGSDNDTVTVFYSEPVVASDATKGGNFRMESPPGKEISLSGASFSFLKGLSATSIKLKENLRFGDGFRVTVKELSDLSGNPLAETAEYEGTVQGDQRRPVLVKAVRNTVVDPSGATVDLIFNEAVDPTSSKELRNYFLPALNVAPVRAEVVKKVEAPRDEELLHQIDVISEGEVRALLEEFTSVPKKSPHKSRVVGYSGDEEAARFIVEEFQKLKLREGPWPDSRVGVAVESFPVTVPVDKGAELETEGGEKVELFSLWPNHVRTSSLPSAGITSELIYVGRGDFAAFNGHNMGETPDEGPIVVMDFNSGTNHVKARWLGAQAIIFIPEDESKVVQGEAYSKFIQVPVDIPRFWASREDAEALKAVSGSRATLRGKMKWETVEAKNIYGWIPGEDTEIPGRRSAESELWSDHMIVVQAHYDSMSVVPRLSPGAEDACGIVALLRVARVLSHYRPKYTVLFLATSGHFEGLKGVFDFVYHHSREESEYYRKRIPPEKKYNFDIMLCLDLSSRNDQVAAFSEGNFVKYQWNLEAQRRNVADPFVGKFLEYMRELSPNEAEGLRARFVNAVSPKGRSWRTYMPVLLALDHEAAIMTGNVAMSLVTPHDLRERVDTPYDSPEYVNTSNLTKQVKTIAGLLMKAGRDPEFFAGSKLKLGDLGRSLSGNIVWFDRDVNFFVPKGKLGGAVVTYESIKPNQPRVKSYAGVRTLAVTQTPEKNPSWENGERGYEVFPISADARRVEVRVWDRSMGKAAHGTVTVANANGVFVYQLADEDGDGVWTTEVNTAKRVHGVSSGYHVIFVFGPVFILGLLFYRKRSLDMRARRIAAGVSVAAFAIMTGWMGFLALQRDLLPAGIEAKPAALEPTVKSITLTDGENVFTVREDIRARCGDFEGQFQFPIRINQLDNVIVSAYVLDDEGEIVFAPDRGTDGDKTYPMKQPYGWWESQMLEVLFPCRAVSVFEAVDSRYLTVLDKMTVLGEDDATPQVFGYDYITGQSTVEGEAVDAAVVYVERRPGERDEGRVKVLMSTGLLGIKYLLTNAPEELLDRPVRPEAVTAELLDTARGNGYPSEAGIILRPSFVGAKDMWVIDDARMKQLQAYGIRNQKLQMLHDRAREELLAAKEHWANKEYGKFVGASREAAGIETRGYPDVKKTANDTVKGVVFYFVLLLPFSMFVERLVFGFVDIRKRIAGFAGVFVVVFVVLHFVHPAFKLSTSPYIIFLAFVMLALGGAVLMLVMSKFNQEVKKIKRAAAGVYEADVGRLSASAAAVMLGISNLRKRKLRTSLTAATLTLLTFTVLSFTSVVTSMKYYRLPRPNFPTYQGVLIRDRNWKALQPSILDYVKSAFEEKARIIPRSWYIAKVRTETDVIDVRNPATGQVTTASGLLGLSPDETMATRPDQLLIGEQSDWFRKGDYGACVMPNDMAKLIGINEDMVGRDGTAKVWMLGAEVKVIGLIDAERFNKLRDLDDEKLTPADMAAEAARVEESLKVSPDLSAAEPIQAFSHLESSNVAFVPYDFLIARGGTPRAVAVTGFDKADMVTELEDFLSRVALTVFVGKDDKVTVYSSMGATSIRGSANLVIPILIASLIVLNTMLGAVYERTTEIGIYSSVGLAPTHVGALFLAEAAVFATLGAVLGYLMGQVTTLVLAHFDLLRGMFLNYSSISAIWSTVVVMATVLLSTLYPAKKAADMAVPDVTRRWKIPEPRGDEWVFDFPFTMSGKEALGMQIYLAKVFDSYTEGSTGGFVAEGVKVEREMVGDESEYRLSMRCWLAPYDLGISQRVMLAAVSTGEFNIYKIEVHLTRLSGDVASWKRINRGFLNMLRKRFLVWRTVPPGEKVKYQEEGEEMLEGKVRTAT